ncbi:hypothetical protein HMPREF9336_02232 [Segniliparus rugosus ATCC BAA-974]|uniref:Lipoprotein n=1 Tax=Segniliparus rugosus (strain ATCC BAA-974 / DSM 45345 / CCUG 50838 / CIP 108380 / JCM 13579 / CDC 945) TaxID=679197 RepID=E5XRW0_SEGRC|nr:hypothetical protein HMPREF9336_02232 [Segniliparus rugosus ATCC BAA-974]
MSGIKLKIAGLTVLALVVATGCSMSGDDGRGNATPNDTNAFNVHLPDNRSVICVSVIDSGYGIGLSCDWRNAK